MSAAVSTPESPTTPRTLKPTPAPQTRTPRLLAAMTAVALVTAGGYWLMNLHQESTDDAQVEGRVMVIAARISGQVSRVAVFDNQRVHAGDVLVELDARDYVARAAAARADLAAAKAAVDSARAALALTERNAPASLAQAQGGLTAATSSLAAARAGIAQARAEGVAAEAQRVYAAANLRRTQELFATHALPQAELDLRQAEADAAAARVVQAEAHLASSEAAVEGSGGGVVLARGRVAGAETVAEQLAAARAAVEVTEARVEQATAALQLADLNVSYTQVRAARDGVVSRRSVEEGQTVGPERPLMAVVPQDDIWVVANFKEDQLRDMRPGQRAEIAFDTFGRRRFAAHVESVSNGTGARFALLPPDNASGNFVKVVQRVPVLLRLDGALDVELRPGMSADATVYTVQP